MPAKKTTETAKEETAVKKTAEKKTTEKAAPKKATDKKPADKTAKKTTAPKSGENVALEQSKALADKIAKALLDKKAFNVTGIKVDHLTTLADYFVIASAKSTTAVRALHETVDGVCKEAGIEVRRREGVREGRWIAMDFGTVILHIFLEEVREFYQLERLWVDGLNITDYN